LKINAKWLNINRLGVSKESSGNQPLEVMLKGNQG
jgi:hypothetical protein